MRFVRQTAYMADSTVKPQLQNYDRQGKAMITKAVFGTLPDGRDVTEYTLTNSHGASVSALDYGGIVRNIIVSDREGKPVDVCLGYDTLEEYLRDDAHLGALIGRFGNRICKGRFVLNGRTYSLAVNDPPNHLHGGVHGFDRQLWEGEARDNRLILRRVSPDGEEGYPGTLRVAVTYTLTEENALMIDYEAVSEGDTVFNPTSHIYFNLNGHDRGTVLGHRLRMDSEAVTANDEHSLPTGEYLPVEGTPFDFRKGKTLGEDIDRVDVQLRYGSGYDHNFVVNGTGERRQVAELTGDESGVVMRVLTDRPGMQLYSANYLTPRRGKNGAYYRERDAVCLETQCYPNATEIPHFPSPVLRAGEVFRSETVYHFSANRP